MFATPPRCPFSVPAQRAARARLGRRTIRAPLILASGHAMRLSATARWVINHRPSIAREPVDQPPRTVRPRCRAAVADGFGHVYIGVRFRGVAVDRKLLIAEQLERTRRGRRRHDRVGRREAGRQQRRIAAIRCNRRGRDHVVDRGAIQQPAHDGIVGTGSLGATGPHRARGRRARRYATCPRRARTARDSGSGRPIPGPASRRGEVPHDG